MCYLEQHHGVSHQDLRAMAKQYLILQKKRQAMKQSTDRNPSRIGEWLEARLTDLKRELVERFVEALEGHPILEWTSIVRGLGPTAALIYAGFIDPHVAESPAKVYAFWGFTPEGKRRAGQKVKGNPDLKRNGWFFAKSVIMKRDCYYYPIFNSKKRYYLSREDIASRKGARAVADRKATYWLAKILLAHAWEKMREGCLLPGCRHKRPYIPPKPDRDAEPPQALLEIILKGERRPVGQP